LKKYYFFIFYIVNFITLHLTYLYHFFCFYLYLFLICFVILFIFFLKNYYTKTKKIVFHCNNCNIVPSFTMLKISLKYYMFFLIYMIFTICKHSFLYSWLYFFLFIIRIKKKHLKNLRCKPFLIFKI